MKKIYIAGKVTGLPHLETEMKFRRKSIELENLGFEAINPLDVVNDPSSAWEPAMRKCIKAMMDADAVFMLPCADNSRGAILENLIATCLDIPVYRCIKNLKYWKK